MARIRNDRHADECDHDSGHSEQPALRVNEHGRLSMHDGRHQRAHNERDSDGDADAQRHAEVAHGKAVAHIAHSPHGAEQSHLQHEGAIECGIEAVKIRQQDEAHADGEQNPREETGNCPCGFPRPLFYFPDGRIKRGRHGRAQNVPSNSSQDYCRHSVSSSSKCGPRGSRREIKAYRFGESFVQTQLRVLRYCITMKL